MSHDPAAFAAYEEARKRKRAEQRALRKLKKEGVAVTNDQPTVEVFREETDEEMALRIASRFSALERMALRISNGTCRSFIVSGAPGLGKSFTLMRALEDVDHKVVRGSISGVGLYIALWQTREPGQVLLLDDADEIFENSESLNLLKAVLETSGRRHVGWHKQSSWLADMGIDDSFDYEGSVVFISNIPFMERIQAGGMNTKHLEALMDRSLYLSLGVHTQREILTRIRQVAPTVLKALDPLAQVEVLDFIEANANRFYSLSIRLVHQIAELREADPVNWQDDVRAFKMR